MHPPTTARHLGLRHPPPLLLLLPGHEALHAPLHHTEGAEAGEHSAVELTQVEPGWRGNGGGGGGGGWEVGVEEVEDQVEVDGRVTHLSPIWAAAELLSSLILLSPTL